MKQHWVVSDLEEKMVPISSARHYSRGNMLSLVGYGLPCGLLFPFSISPHAVAIDDGQVSQLLEQVGLPLPWQILKECCRR